MIRINISEETNSVVSMAEALRRIADLVEEGYTSGYEPEWLLSGQEEDPTAEDEEEESDDTD